MSCGCKCSYCVSCSSNPKISEKEITKEIQDYRKEKRLYTKKQAD